MIKQLLISIITSGILVLSACQGRSPTTLPYSITPLPAATASRQTPSQSVSPLPAGCTIVSLKPSPGPTQESIFPPVSKADWVLGPFSAHVTILEYADFQDPLSATLEPILAAILERYPNDVRLVYRHFPLESVHDKAALAVQAAEAAGKQDKFWVMHDLLFSHQAEWSTLTPDPFSQWLATQAAGIGLNKEQFSIDSTSPELAAIADQAWKHNKEIGLPGTPFVLVNGQIWANNLPMTEATISSIIDLELLERKQFTACPPMTIDPHKQYTATLRTTKGDIVIKLFADKSPIAVNNFIFLARQGWYDGVTFHRVLPGFFAQGGDPSGTGFGGPGYAFVNENSPGLKFDNPGLLAMANTGPDTNGSQFFITYSSQPSLNGGYTIFGEVVMGLDVAESLTPRDPSQMGELPPGDKILSITIVEQ